MEVVARLVIGLEDRRIVAVVRDYGGSPGGGADAGVWLTMVNACMDRVQIRSAESGTSVTMTSKPVPLLGVAAASAGVDA